MESSRESHDKLRKLLALKRYEQPPPGFFFTFSDRVLNRIEVGETGSQATWWSWFVQGFDTKPILACAYAASLAILLAAGFGASNAFESELLPANPASGAWFASGQFFTSEMTPFEQSAALNPEPPLPPTLQSALRPEPAGIPYRHYHPPLERVTFTTTR